MSRHLVWAAPAALTPLLAGGWWLWQSQGFAVLLSGFASFCL